MRNINFELHLLQILKMQNLLQDHRRQRKALRSLQRPEWSFYYGIGNKK